MKISLIEKEQCFAFRLEAETIQDAALLTRFGTNATGEVRSLGICAHQEGKFDGYLVLGKHKRADGYVQKRR